MNQWLVGVVIRSAVSAFQALGLAARRFLTPRTPLLDAQIERLAAWRAWIGLLLVVAANLAWKPETTDLLRAVGDAQFAAMLLPLQIAACVVFGSLLLVATARRGHRRRMLANAWVPVRTVLVSFATIAALFIALGLLMQLMPYAGSGRVEGLQVALLLVVPLISLALLFVMGSFIAHGAKASVRHFFRARDAHPALRAIIVLMLATWTLFVGLSDLAARGPDPVFPLWVTSCLLVVGPLMNIGLSMYEIGRLKRIFGIDLRAAP